MSKKMSNLQQALNSTVTPVKVKPEKQLAPVVISNDAEKSTPRAPSRQGKENVSAWLNPDFKKSLRLAQIRKSGKVYIDDLIAEALNDLFLKYDVPTVQHD